MGGRRRWRERRRVVDSGTATAVEFSSDSSPLKSGVASLASSASLNPSPNSQNGKAGCSQSSCGHHSECTATDLTLPVTHSDKCTRFHKLLFGLYVYFQIQFQIKSQTNNFFHHTKNSTSHFRNSVCPFSQCCGGSSRPTVCVPM